MNRTSGFSLMEALVALAIAATVMTGVFAVQHQLVQGQIRADKIIADAQIQRNVLALLRDVNPGETPEGEIVLPPSLTVSWSSEAISDEKLTTGYPRGDGAYYATLYRLTVTVQTAQGQDAIAPFTLERTGWSAESIAG